eukprot:365815-Chlamydomonas_euryale.AAC.7
MRPHLAWLCCAARRRQRHRVDLQERPDGAEEALVAQKHCGHLALRPETDRVRDRLHCVRVAADEKAAEEDALDVVPHCVEVRELANIVADHARKGDRDVGGAVVGELLVLSNDLSKRRCDRARRQPDCRIVAAAVDVADQHVDRRVVALHAELQHLVKVLALSQEAREAPERTATERAARHPLVAAVAVDLDDADAGADVDEKVRVEV